MSTQAEPVAAPDVSDAVEMTYREAVTAALEDEMAADASIYLLGEDVANDGGVFKTNMVVTTDCAVPAGVSLLNTVQVVVNGIASANYTVIIQ